MKRTRGRPRADTLPLRYAFTGTRRFALEVFRIELSLGRKRGDLTTAIRRVVDKWPHLDEDNRARALRRHRDLRKLAELMAVIDPDEAVVKEPQRRMLDMPDDVREYLLALPWSDLLVFLRTHNIDAGRYPGWLVHEVARAHRWELTSGTPTRFASKMHFVARRIERERDR